MIEDHGGMPESGEQQFNAGRQHVAIVVNNYPPKVGGLESHVSHLASSLQERGIHVTVVAVDNDVPSGLVNGVEVVRLKGTPMVAAVFALPWPGTGAKLRTLLTERGVTIISTHTRFFPMSFVAIRAGKRLGVPVIHTEHGSDHVRGVTPFIGLASRVVDVTMGKYILRHASKVLAISSAAQDFVFALAGVKSRIFHNAIDTSVFSARATGESLPAARLVFLGRLVDGKGWKMCLAVGEALALEFPDLELHFIGDGAQRSDLEATLSTSSIGKNSLVHGYLQAPSIRDILSDGILLNPTTLAEGFQTTLLEAVSSGAAVVSTPVAAAKYLADAGAPVTVVQTMDERAWIDACRSLLSHTRKTVSNGLLETFDWSERAREYEEIVTDVTAAG